MALSNSDSLRLLKEDEVAEILRLSPATLRLWRSTGKGPRFVKIGGSIRYANEALQEYLSPELA